MPNFRSKAAYHRWLAFGHIHEVFKKTPGHQKVKIRGKVHKVNHIRKRRRKKR